VREKRDKREKSPDSGMDSPRRIADPFFPLSLWGCEISEISEISPQIVFPKRTPQWFWATNVAPHRTHGAPGGETLPVGTTLLAGPRPADANAIPSTTGNAVTVKMMKKNDLSVTVLPIARSRARYHRFVEQANKGRRI
jgi:hypothetical protein